MDKFNFSTVDASVSYKPVIIFHVQLKIHGNEAVVENANEAERRHQLTRSLEL